VTAPNAELAYRVTFARIGRSHDVPPLEVDARDAETLGAAIYKYGRKHLGSRYVDVEVDMENGRGEFFCGIRSGGTFSFGPRPEATS
jgi:hypothetical protein